MPSFGMGPKRVRAGRASSEGGDEGSVTPLAASAASLTFTTQKNGVENEVIKLGRSGDPIVFSLADADDGDLTSHGI